MRRTRKVVPCETMPLLRRLRIYRDPEITAPGFDHEGMVSPFNLNRTCQTIAQMQQWSNVNFLFCLFVLGGLYT